jgi:hypothetical protein
MIVVLWVSKILQRLRQSVPEYVSQVPAASAVSLTNWPENFVVTGPNVSHLVVFSAVVPRPFFTHVRSNERGDPTVHELSPVMLLMRQS